MNKRILIGATIAVVVLSLFVILNNQSKSKDNQELVSGTFHGKSEGQRGDIKLDVVIVDNRITHIEILEHNETPGFDKAMVMLADDIVAKNSLDVDCISGATKTSQSFIEAIKKTLKKAGIAPQDLIALDETSILNEGEHSKTNCDILIIGGGGAGFTAAIEALSSSDNSVVVLEKMSFGGGNTRMSGGEYAAPGNWVQLSEGITKDSIEVFFNDIYEGAVRRESLNLYEL